MELRRLCAYNQTRECFLGLEVAPVNLACAELKKIFRKLTLKSGEGLWMDPFRGLPETDMGAPLDLIYLDEECRVIVVVEAYPTFRVSPSVPEPASILALPIHSIYLSQTQMGDQLVLCVAEEMESHLERISSTSGAAGGVQSAVLLRGTPLWSGGPGVGVADLEDRPGKDNLAEIRSTSVRPYEMDIIEPGVKYVKPAKNWLMRLLPPDPKTAPDLRDAPRESQPGLSAYYWTGAPPKAHNIKDISATGLYVVTEERWYPGTLILMTLQALTDGQDRSETALSVHSRAVRWGSDGVGLQFIPQDTPAARSLLNPLEQGANMKELVQFLEGLRKGNV